MTENVAIMSEEIIEIRMLCKYSVFFKTIITYCKKVKTLKWELLLAFGKKKLQVLEINFPKSTRIGQKEKECKAHVFSVYNALCNLKVILV